MAKKHHLICSVQSSKATNIANEWFISPRSFRNGHFSSHFWRAVNSRPRKLGTLAGGKVGK